MGYKSNHIEQWFLVLSAPSVHYSKHFKLFIFMLQILSFKTLKFLMNVAHHGCLLTSWLLMSQYGLSPKDMTSHMTMP